MNIQMRTQFTRQLFIFTALLFSGLGCSTTTNTAQTANLQPVENVITNETVVTSAFDSYNPLTVQTAIELTPSEEFSSGTFCRLYHDDTKDQFFAAFGTGQGQPNTGAYIGGGEGGQGAAYLYLDSDLQPTSEAGYYRYGGGDLATNKIGNYLYHLTGTGGGVDGGTRWRLSKYDLASWSEVDYVDIDLTAEQGANDQMLAYANNQLFASSLYANNAHGADTSGEKADPSIGASTHHRAITPELSVAEAFVLDDTLHANGSSLVFVDGVYQLVTTTAFFGDLMVLQYDEDWNYLGAKVLLADAQWPQGTVYDTAQERYYVAYLAIKGGGQSETRLAAFTKDWELVSNTVVTEYGNAFFAGRPSVLLHDGLLYVTYDKESRNEQTKELNKDWQCQLSVYETTVN